MKLKLTFLSTNMNLIWSVKKNQRLPYEKVFDISVFASQMSQLHLSWKGRQANAH